MTENNAIELKDILAVSGQPGLFKYVAQSPNGIIVESLTQGTRTKVSSTARVSSLGEIAIFTDGDDMPLGEVFDALFAHTEGRETISPKSTPEEMKALFAAVVPGYDRDRVHVSDMKKAIAWFNILVGAGMTRFAPEENEEEAEDEQP